MANPTRPLNLRNPWLVAAWPGMGQVATGAVAALIETLDAKPAGVIPGSRYFDLDHMDIRDGIARSGALPRNMFFVWRDPEQRRDLLLFLAEAKPAHRGSDLCRRIVAFARTEGVKQIVTFAALPTQLEPSGTPSVQAAVTAPALLGELRDHQIPVLREGRVGGLNGTLLAAAATAGIPALCLLGEMPFFAAGAPNLKTSLATLHAFGDLADLDLDLKPLQSRAAAVESQLEQLFEQLREQASQQLASLAETHEIEPEEAEEADEADEAGAADAVEPVDPAAELRIEKLFDTVEHDRDRAGELKAELDRLGLYDAYEDRFLDLFRKAG